MSELLYGIHAVQSALLQYPERVKTVWVDTSRTGNRLEPIVELANRAGITVQSISRKTLDRRVPDVSHQGVMADYRPLQPMNEVDLPARIRETDNPLLLVLDGVKDPHNLGACLRTAAAAGAVAVIAPRHRSAPLTPAARKVASGASEIIPFVQVANLTRTLNTLKELGIHVVGTSVDAKTPLYNYDMAGGHAIVLGGEEKGMRRLTREACDDLIRIPIHASMESLNVSVAAGVCLFEFVRQSSTLSGRQTKRLPTA